jgi:hypothetical protein
MKRQWAGKTVMGSKMLGDCWVTDGEMLSGRTGVTRTRVWRSLRGRFPGGV